MMFLLKRVLWGNGASQVKPDQVENILTLRFGCMDILLYFIRLEKNLNSILSFGQATLTFCLPGAMATCCVS